MKIRRPLAIGMGIAVLAPLAFQGSAGAATPAASAASGAIEWLSSQQQADGGFELAGFAGFETPDATLAIGAVGRETWVDPVPVDALATGPWDKADALASVQALTENNKSALDAIDALIDGAVDPTTVASGARAAKIAALVAEPLGIDPTDFDPANDSANPVDLIARMDLHKQVDGSYDFGAQFNGLLYTALALDGDGLVVPNAVVDQIRAAQRSDGSWDYTGTTTGDGNDIDTTALALQALRAAGLTTADADVAAGVTFLGSRQQASGAWQAFGGDDPNSTAMATVALGDLHIDVTTSAWRATFGAPVSGSYASPIAWLVSQVDSSDGHIKSPNDGFGVNSFASTQAVEALARQWFLADESQSLMDRWSEDLASPAAAPVTTNVSLASPGLPTNPSVKVQRLAGATAIVTSAKGREAAAADLFKQAFNRSIDPSGKAYWSTKLVTISRPEMLSRLTGSSEFYRKAGGTIPKFVDAVYQSVLGRAADPSGRAYWIAKLEAGRSVEGVARSLVASSEYRRHQVNDAFDRILDRAPTTGERNYWTTKIATTRIEVLLATLGATSEFYELAPA